MKTAKNSLVFFLLLLAVKDAVLGSLLLFNLHWIVNHAGMTYSNDVNIMATFFGVCVLIVSTLCIAAINRVLYNKTDGIGLSKFVAWWMVIASIIVYFKIKRPEWAVIDFITGVLILIPAYLYQRKAIGVPDAAMSHSIE